jgi:hypothetical protein
VVRDRDDVESATRRFTLDLPDRQRTITWHSMDVKVSRENCRWNRRRPRAFAIGDRPGGDRSRENDGCTDPSTRHRATVSMKRGKRRPAYSP